MEKTYLVGKWQIETQLNRICDGDDCKTIEPQCISLLSYLAENENQVVSRQELLDHVWKDTIVSDNTITKTIALLRRALDDDSKNPRYIKTIAKKGYVLIAQVSQQNEVGQTKVEQQQQTVEPNSKEIVPSEINLTASTNKVTKIDRDSQPNDNSFGKLLSLKNMLVTVLVISLIITLIYLLV